MKEAFDFLKHYNYGEDRGPLKPLEEAIVNSHGDENARKEIEAGLIEVLNNKKGSRKGKDYACRKLKIVGTDACVDALAGKLNDNSHSHMARFALQSIPTEAATNALIGALSKVGGELKAGVIGSLGARGDQSAVSAIAGMLGDGNTTIARSAACALGAIGGKEAADALAAAKPSDAIMGDVMDATLSCAEALLESGDKVAALSIYKKLSTNPAKHIKLAATRGMLACAGK
ncbi:MAG: HEAT repeat domain-containing protein [Planctomycetota bacterium]